MEGDGRGLVVVDAAEGRPAAVAGAQEGNHGPVVIGDLGQRRYLREQRGVAERARDRVKGVFAQYDDTRVVDVERAALAIDEYAGQDTDTEHVGERAGAQVGIARLGEPEQVAAGTHVVDQRGHAGRGQRCAGAGEHDQV